MTTATVAAHELAFHDTNKPGLWSVTVMTRDLKEKKTLVEAYNSLEAYSAAERKVPGSIAMSWALVRETRYAA